MSDSYQDAVSVMAATPGMVRALVGELDPAILDRAPAADAWSPRQVLAHLLHVETAVIGPRVQRMLAEDNPELQPAAPPSPAGDPRRILADWLDARQRHLPWLRGLSATELARSGRHPRYGTITVREHVVEWAYHDLDHLRQLMAALQAGLYPEIGGFQALYPPPV